MIIAGPVASPAGPARDCPSPPVSPPPCPPASDLLLGRASRAGTPRDTQAATLPAAGARIFAEEEAHSPWNIPFNGGTSCRCRAHGVGRPVLLRDRGPPARGLPRSGLLAIWCLRGLVSIFPSLPGRAFRAAALTDRRGRAITSLHGTRYALYWGPPFSRDTVGWNESVPISRP